MVTRRTALSAIGAAPLVFSQRARRPNLLFIIADDHAGYVLGADGNRLARTPNLDRLAGEGTRYAAHYCNSPVCTASRQSLLTGQLPHVNGVTRLPTPLRDGTRTLATQLREAGYVTAVYGKMHFNQPGHPGLHGFEIAETEDVIDRRWQAEVKPSTVSDGIRTKPRWRPFQDPARIWLNAENLPFPRVEREMRSGFLLDQAKRFLEEHRDRPFALWASFQEPHSPFDFPIEDRGRFDPARFTPPRVGPEDGEQIPKVFRGLSDADKRGIIAAYYTSAEFLDRNVGQLLAKLHELGLDRDTLVVYTADHGYCLGHHGRFEKHCGYEPALRVPLLMRGPGVRPKVVRDFTEHVDLACSITDALGLTNGGGLPHRDHIFSEYLENEEAYIRTSRWKFVYCSGRRARRDGYETDDPTPGPYVRLFDMKHDPGEFTNIAPRAPEIVRRMKSLMLARFSATEESLEQRLRPPDA